MGRRLVSAAAGPFCLMIDTNTILVRFVCPWRDNRPNDVREIPAAVAVQLFRVHVAVPAGTTRRFVETTAGSGLTMIEKRDFPN